MDQVRGYSPIVASYDSLKHLDDFAIAELIAAKIASCQGVFYERNSQTPAGDFLDQGKLDDHGAFMTELSPGSCNIVPNGYSVKTMTPNHPNSQFG
ncbi:MAG: phage portal protein [Methanobrevibacter sp.]|nr:phage portal protein [Methanobrevibacter sp.]MBO7717060.1 phage portal protein [Methanobrevibacter sp.]